MIRLLIQHVRLPALVQITDLIPADAHIDDTQVQLRVHTAQKRARIRHIAGAPGIEQALAHRLFPIVIRNGVADEQQFIIFSQNHLKYLLCIGNAADFYSSAPPFPCPLAGFALV